MLVKITLTPAPFNAIKLRPDLTPDPFPKGRGDLIPLYSPSLWEGGQASA